MEESLMNIVQQAADKISQEMAKQFVGIQNHVVNFSDLVSNIQKCVNEIGISMVESLVIEADNALRQSPVRKREWHIQRNEDTKVCSTLMGPIELTRTYYKHKSDGSFSYLLDEYLGILPYDRMDIGLEAEILKTATERSYQQTVNQFQHSGITSKESIKNIVHRLEVEQLEIPVKGQKTTPKVLFIEADEDHVSYQDGKNRFMKLVYIHEGYQPTTGKSKRHSLKNCHYFSGLYPDNQRLWEEVYAYLDSRYNLKEIKRIYFSGDGAQWIKEGAKYIPNTTFVLDRFHMVKYVKKACVGMLDSTQLVLDWIDQNQKEFIQSFFFSRLSDTQLADNQRIEITKAKTYLLGNWEAIQNQHNLDYVGCSAEGHVSHVLSSRLSSRPLGWSKTGANNIAKMRVFLRNEGNLLVHLELKNKKVQKKSRIKKLDKRVNKSKHKVNQAFLAKLPMLENGQLTGTKYRLECLINH